MLLFLLNLVLNYAEDGSTGAGSEGSSTEGVEGVTLQLSDHSTYARNKLAHLQERLTNKLLVSPISDSFVYCTLLQ